jgi:phage terminase small subunit
VAGTTYSTTTQQGDTMYRPRPEVAMRDGAWKRVMDGLRDFGCTPSSRAKVTTAEAMADDAERFFGTG